MCVVLVVHHAKRVPHIVSSVGCVARPYFSTSSQTTRFSENFIEYKICVLIFIIFFFLQILSEAFLILRRIQRDIIIIVCRCLCVKCRLFLSDFNNTSFFLTTDLRKTPRCNILLKFVPREQSVFMRTDRRTVRYDELGCHIS